MEPYIIGIDVGTGSTKAIAMNYAGKIIDSAQVPYPTLHPNHGHFEQAPELIWQAFIKCIFRITQRRKKSPSAVSLSSVMHSMIPVDKHGTALMNMIIWADHRSAAIATRIFQSSSAEMLYEQTGTPIHAMSPLCKIQWLRDHAPEIFNKTFKFISIKEYIWHKLFRRFEVDYSIASATGLMDIEKLTWNDNALARAGITTTHLSKLVNTDYKTALTDEVLCRETGLQNDTPVFIGASDGCLANIGSFATEEGVMALTIGTSGAVRVARQHPLLNFKAMTFNYRLDDTTFICGGPTNNGGVVLKWYAENFLGTPLNTANDYLTFFHTVMKSKPGGEGLLFLPYILGERAPIWNSEATGAFFGIRGYHNPSHFARAVIEGISMALYHIAHTMMDTGLLIKQIHVSGGFVHSEQWLQILANLFGKKLCLINTADASAIGASYLAMKSLGIIDDFAQLRPTELTEYMPQQEHLATYQQLFEKYQKLYLSIADQMTTI